VCTCQSISAWEASDSGLQERERERRGREVRSLDVINRARRTTSMTWIATRAPASGTRGAWTGRTRSQTRSPTEGRLFNRKKGCVVVRSTEGGACVSIKKLPHRDDTTQTSRVGRRYK